MSNPNGRNFLGGGYDHFAHQTDSADLEASGFSAGENSYLHQLMAGEIHTLLALFFLLIKG